MHRRTFLLAASAATFAPSLALAAEGGETGVFRRAEPAGANDEPQNVFYHRPAKWRASDRIVMVQHGVARNAATYRNDWIQQAEHFGFLLICPEFSRSKFPRDWYSQGGLSHTTDRQRWSFAVPDRIFADVKARFAATATKYSLYGHSAGSQFVHRMTLISPSPLVERAVVANAGFYTLPLFDTPYPYGLKGLDLSDPQVAHFLRWPLMVLLGESDTNPNHPELLRNAEADAQGIHRFQRGMNFMEVGRREAARRGIELAWRVATVPGVPHSNRRMAPSAAAHLFE